MTTTTSKEETASAASAAWWRRLDLYLVAVVVGVGVVLRFVTSSPMWLDEALSVNIATLSIPDIFDALRQDGHPPLYYVLLHGWMAIVGEGELAIRSLSGIISVATLPLVWVLAHRRSGTPAAVAAVVLSAVIPFNLRYATEARMYSLVSLLAIAAWLLADDLHDRPDRRRWVLLALCTGAGLLTHYWAIYMGMAAVVLLGLRWYRSGDRTSAIRIGSALAAGCVFFLPWLPSFLYQVGHTGTPWSSASRPTQAVQELFNGLGGGSFAEGSMTGGAILLLAALGLFAVGTSGSQVVLDFRTAGPVRAEAAMVAATMAIGIGAGLASQAAFIARYAAGIVPLIVVVAGVGVAHLPSRWMVRGVLLAVSLLSVVGIYYNITDPRTQGEAHAETIVATGTPDDLVAICPDQLGPSLLRALPDEIDAVGIPAMERPDRIDWVDYADRNRAADPDDVVEDLLARADGHSIWVVFSGSYRTYEDLCAPVLDGLSAASSTGILVTGERGDAFERSSLYRYDP